MVAQAISSRIAALLVICTILLNPGAVLAQAQSSSVTVSATIGNQTGSLRMTGYASPNSLVTFLRNGSVIGTSTADSNSFFDKTITGLDPGVQSFGIYASDTSGRTTLTVGFETNIIVGYTLTISGFLLPATINVEKPVIKRPEKQSSLGSARNGTDVTAFFNNGDQLTKRVPVDGSGNWKATMDQVFHLGTRSTSAIVQDGSGNQSVESQSVPFTVVLSADLNVDDRVNLFDFSILMFNYGTSKPPNLAADINDNGPVDLVDFSVMMFHWNGG